MKKLLSLFLVLALAFSLCVGVLADETTAAEPTDETAGELAGQIVILHTNDVHGAIDGYAKVAALKADYEAKGAEVLLVDAGDFIQGTTSVSVSQGATAVELMNLAGYDLVTLGNHEFDYGMDNLKTIFAKAEFGVVAANIKLNGAAAFDANKVVELADGTKLGVFGLATPETATKANPAKIKGVTFLAESELYACAEAQVKALTDAGCDYIICLGHLGIDKESEPNRSIDLLGKVSGIDVFIDGHSHSTLDEVKAATDGTGKVGDTLLTSTGTAAANVGVVTITKDGITASSVDLSKYEGSVKAVADRAAAIKAEIDAQYGEVFAKTEVDLNGERDPGNRTEETNLGDLIADILRDSFGIDLMLMGSGAIRSYSLGPVVHYADLVECLPYDDAVYMLKVTGTQLERMIRHILRDEAFKGEHTEFYQFSHGMRIVWSRSGQVFRELTLDGEALYAERLYTVAVQKYHYNNLKPFLNITLEEAEQNGKIRVLSTSARDVVEEYLTVNQHLSREVEGRLVVEA